MKVDGINPNATIVVAIRLADDGNCAPWLENAHEEGKPARSLPLQSKLHDLLARHDIQIQVPPHFARFFVTTLLAPVYGMYTIQSTRPLSSSLEVLVLPRARTFQSLYT